MRCLRVPRAFVRGSAARLFHMCTLAIVVSLLTPWSAHAVDTVIGFDDQPANQLITTQYTPLGLNFTGGAFAPTVQAVPFGVAASNPNVLSLFPHGCEFCHALTRGVFTDGVTHQHVSVRAGILGTLPHTAVVSLVARDIDDNVVAQASGTVTTGGGVFTLLDAISPNQDIYSIVVGAPGSDGVERPIAIDDLTFDKPAPAATPDFVVTGPESASVLAGFSSSTPITIDRINNSTGPIDLAITGTPPGVTASITPATTSSSTATLNLTAAAGAPPAVQDATLTATPTAAAAGPKARSRQVQIRVGSGFSVFGPSEAQDLSSCNRAVPITITRDPSFTGTVDLTVAGAAPGLGASLVTSSVTFSGGSRSEVVTLNLGLPPDGVARPSRITVSGSSPGFPSRSTGFDVGGACPIPLDARVQSIQVNQGIQNAFLPQNPGGRPFSYLDSFTGLDGWGDIPLAHLMAGRVTIVRVWANVSTAPLGGVPNVRAVLRGEAEGRPLAEGPLLPVGGPRTLFAGPLGVSDVAAGSPDGAYTFVLPDSWTRHDFLHLTAEILPPAPGTTTPSFSECSAPACTANNAFRLVNVKFNAPPPTAVLRPLAMVIGSQVLPDPDTVFAPTRTVSPVPVAARPYQAIIDIGDIAADPMTYPPGSDAANVAVGSRVDDWDNANGTSDATVGVNSALNPATAVGIARGWRHTYYHIPRYHQNALVDAGRPLTSVVHEVFHLLGRPHASPCQPGTGSAPGSEPWPPDQQGFIQGSGLDPTPGSAGLPGLFRILLPDAANPFFDLMSYCATIDDQPTLSAPGRRRDAWISLHTWNTLAPLTRSATRSVAPAKVGRAVPRAATPAVRALGVSAYVIDGAVTITRVGPQPSGRAPASTASAYLLVVKDRAGRELSRTPMAIDAAVQESAAVVSTLNGAGTLDDAARVEIVAGGSVVASRDATGAAPRVRVTLPRRHERVGGASDVAIRWRTTATSRAKRVATVEYSADAGQSWRTVFTGPNRGRATLPGAYLRHARSARVRVTVNDGFREGSATSPVFSSRGTPPQVSILSSGPAQRIRNDAYLDLRGSATDDESNFLNGRALRWYAGERLLGRGAKISATGLAPGRRTIRLVARDKRGRKGSATTQVSVIASAPAFLTLRAPSSLPRRARGLRIHVATSLPATLAIRGRRYRVDRRVRTIRVGVGRGTKRIVLRLQLRAFGRTSETRLVVPRS